MAPSVVGDVEVISLIQHRGCLRVVGCKDATPVGGGDDNAVLEDISALANADAPVGLDVKLRNVNNFFKLGHDDFL